MHMHGHLSMHKYIYHIHTQIQVMINTNTALNAHTLIYKHLYRHRYIYRYIHKYRLICVHACIIRPPRIKAWLMCMYLHKQNLSARLKSGSKSKNLTTKKLLSLLLITNYGPCCISLVSWLK